jgi:hypothetical protein
LPGASVPSSTGGVNGVEGGSGWRIDATGAGTGIRWIGDVALTEWVGSELGSG